MCFVLQNDLGKGRCAPVASPAKWCFPIPFAWPDQKVVMQGPDQHPRGDFALPDSPAKAELPPSTKGRACPLRPSRLQRGKGAFCAPLDPMTKGAFRQPLWKPSTNRPRLDARWNFATRATIPRLLEARRLWRITAAIVAAPNLKSQPIV